MLLLLGGALLKISAFLAVYANYVKPGFRPVLIATGAVLIVMPGSRPSANRPARATPDHVRVGLGWTKTFTDPRLCAAIVDRLTFGGNIIETGTDSFRLARTRARNERSDAD
jgi:hypothetical protein